MKRLPKFLIALLIVFLLLAACGVPDNQVEQQENNTITEPEGETEREEEAEALCRSEHAVEFESQPLGTIFNVGDQFSENGVTVSFEDFMGTNGQATIQNEGDAGGSGHEVWLNNITTRFSTACPVHNLTLYYGFYGGSLYIEINGDQLDFFDITDLDGKNWPDAVSYLNPINDNLGILVIEGEIRSFAFGGQELALDVYCPEEMECVGLCPSGIGVEFESQPLGATFVVGDWFAENGFNISFEPFAWSEDTSTTEGVATIQDGGDAGGSGHEMWLNNITARFTLPCLIQNLTLYYGAYGGNLNIEINGEFLNFGDMADLDGKPWPGATSYINDLGGGMGILLVEGEIWSFSIGGQELVIDVFCPEKLDCGTACREFCVDFESQILGTSYTVFDLFTENGVTIFFQPFIWSDGRITSEGQANIDSSGNAGGSGNEMWINNINARFIFPCEINYLMLRFGEYGGNLNLEINGQFVNFENFIEIDGAIIGGVEVHVLAGGGGNDQGILEFVGDINSFMIGGQEFVIDDLCNFSYE